MRRVCSAEVVSCFSYVVADGALTRAEKLNVECFAKEAKLSAKP